MLEECFDTDVLDYFPIRDGLKASSIGLRKLPKDKLKDPRNFIFQIDEFFAHYRKNKIECRKEKLCKYYQVVAPAPQELIQFFLDTLLDEYPQSFKLTRLEKNWQFECLLSKETLVFDEKLNLLEAQSKYERDEVGGPYVDAWDALSMQVSEDLVLQKVPGNERDFTQVIHLCHANGWSAEGAVGQSFDKIHEDVPGINKLIPDSRKILSAILRSEHTMERVGALQYRTSGELNRHPQISRADLNQDFDL
ncbi:DUF3445 domain-containing protein, partial [bacterium]|nr:DUF3445 domain-containing protein [bacterium]